MRWLHIASVIVLLGGVFYARFAAREMAAGFKPMAYAAIGAILVSGTYNFLNKTFLSAALSYVVRYQNFACSPRLRRGRAVPEREIAGADRRRDFRRGDRGDFRIFAMDFAPVTAVEVTPGYRALREGAAWMDLSARGKIRATGEDRARLLHAMTTNHIEQLRPGEGCYAFFLNAQGRILGDANILCFEDSLLLDTEPETRVKAVRTPGALHHRRRRDHGG